MGNDVPTLRDQRLRNIAEETLAWLAYAVFVVCFVPIAAWWRWRDKHASMACPRCEGSGGPCDRCFGTGRRSDPQVDSREGITALMDWARHGGWVLNEWHERIAKKHGVSTDGVVFSQPIPLDPR